MDLGLQGKVALITGASRGIGRAIATALANEGCQLAICARGAEALEQAAGELRQSGAAVLAVPADVTRREECQQLVAAVMERYERLDVLVNNVGGGGGPSLEETSDAQWEGAFDLTFWPSLQLSRLAIPTMKAQNSGVIIMIGSIYGREWGGRPAYMAVKSAQVSLAKAMARELAPAGIRVITVAPGSILFPGGSWDRRVQESPEAMAQFVRAEMPMGRFGRPEEVANVVAFLASDRASLVTGACVNVDGCQSRSLI